MTDLDLDALEAAARDSAYQYGQLIRSNLSCGQELALIATIRRLEADKAKLVGALEPFGRQVPDVDCPHHTTVLCKSSEVFLAARVLAEVREA